MPLLLPVFDRAGPLIAQFLQDNQTQRRVATDERKQKAEQLLNYQKYLLAAVLISIAVLLILAWVRSMQAMWLAKHDILTQLANRPATIEALREISEAASGNPKLALHCIDLDRFKMVNDTLGHEVGDEILQRFSRRIEAMAGAGNLVARSGSNQFTILQRDVSEAADAMHLAHKIIFSATNAFVVDEHQLRMGVSMGVAMSVEDAAVNKRLFDRADLALYEAKRRGGNNAVIFDPSLEERAERHRRIDTDLRKALDRGELVNYYQPKIDLATRRICGAEALLRWFHPEQGMVRPDHFIPIAEDTRLIIPIGTWAANQACSDAKNWTELCGGDFHIAVNLSPVQFESDTLVSEIRRALKKHDLDPHCLELEITESTLMENSRNIEHALKRLRSLGIRFALDDFGTGYSSLSYLDRFRFDKVKIDRSFVMALDPKTPSSPIIEAVVHMARGMHFEVCAEGIEDEPLAGLLQDLGCHEAQGYFFGKPMPADEFTAYLIEQHKIERRAVRATAAETETNVDMPMSEQLLATD